MQLNLIGKHEHKPSLGRVDNFLFNEGEMNKKKKKDISVTVVICGRYGLFSVNSKQKFESGCKCCL